MSQIKYVFEASYTLTINTKFAGLWSIPVPGSIGDNGLNISIALTSTTNRICIKTTRTR
ncbi:hypothetical protein [Winogradskyella schleiferi]|uniref:hypothetical protein n=1 Tax=Winogradskyella schleiferi TaxID=2686078 RepID=UPI0015B879D4|nr:hypothetical protein [Winogradskyella schleiferi]